MKELTQICAAVIAALNTAGVAAMTAFPAQRAKDYRGAVAAVQVGAAEGKPMGFCNYLGQRYDDDAGTVLEIYGKQLEGSITVDVRANNAAECEQGCQKSTEVLLGGLPDGIRGGELAWEGLRWEKETGMFLRRGTLKCQALFLAEADEENATFLDFRLKGDMTD